MALLQTVQAAAAVVLSTALLLLRRLLPGHIRGGRPGTTVPVTFVGYGIKSGVAQLETLVSNVVFPKDDAGTGWYQHRLKTPHGQALPVSLRLADFAELVEPGAGAARPLAPGAAITGTLSKRGEIDEYSFPAKAGQMFRFEAISAEIGTRLDPVLRVVDKDDKQVAINDDFGNTLDSRLDFKAPADGTYRVRLHNGTGEDGRLDSVYRLTSRLQQPGFTLSLPQAFAAPVGGKAALTVSCVRTGGLPRRSF